MRLIDALHLAGEPGTPDIIAYPATRRGWGRLTRLLTVGNLAAKKGDCILTLPDLLDHSDDLLLIAMDTVWLLAQAVVFAHVFLM